MKLFTKADNAKLFANYSKGSNMANQNVVVKIFNPYGNGRWYIMNSDPNDPDYLWGIVDLGYGAEVGSISRSDLENYRTRMGWGFERDMSFRPKNAKMVLEGLRNGDFFDGGGEVEFIDYGDSEIMFEPNSKKYYANDMEFDTLEQAKKFIDSGEVPEHIRDAYSKGLFAGGGATKKTKLFTKEDDKILFKQHQFGKDLKKQDAIVEIYQNYGNIHYYIVNADPKDPDTLLAIIQDDINDEVEVDFISRKLLENKAEHGIGGTTERIFDTTPYNADRLYWYLATGKFYVNGGAIKNQYEGRTPENVWENLSKGQRSHFLYDHIDQIQEYKNIDKLPNSEVIVAYNSDWMSLDKDIKNRFANHVREGEYKKGGALLSPKQRYIAELKGLTGLQQKAIEDYIDENNLTSDEVLRIVIGLGRKQISRSDVSTAIVGKKNNSESKKLLAFAMSDEALKAEYGGFMDGVYAGGGGLKKYILRSDEYKVESNVGIFYKVGTKTYWYVVNSKNQTINKNTGKPYRGKDLANYYFLSEDGAKDFAEKLNKGLFVERKGYEGGGFMDGVYAGGGSISNFDPMSLIGKTFYSLQSHGKIINVRILSDDNIKIKYEVSNTFSVEKSFTKKELFDMAKGKEVDGNSILKGTMAYGGFMDGVYAGGGGVSDKFVITKKPDANSLYYIVYSENGKKVPSSELPTNIGYGKIKNEFLSKRKRYDNSLGLQDAVTIVMKMNDKESYSGGGKTTFADKSSAIAKNFVGKAVELLSL
jgi:hypothetical protein